jgi:hypothetical protein
MSIMPKLFISYRRQDSSDLTGRLHDRLKTRFGQDAIFVDIDSILPGIDFRRAIADGVKQCNALLAVIGEQWLDAEFEDGPKEGQRRLDDPDDYVRIEVETALGRGIPVIPVLVGRATMPRAGDLPEGLKDLAYRNAVEVRSGADFHGHIERLIASLDRLLARRQTLGDRVESAIRVANVSPKMALAGLREALELLVRDVYEHRFGEPPGRRSVENLVDRMAKETGLPPELDLAGLCRRLNESGTACWDETMTADDVHRARIQLAHVLKWYVEVEQPDALGRRADPPGPLRQEADGTGIDPGAPPAAAPPRARIAVVPKGLRSFDKDDSDFFLELLPGPRDKDGLPESLRFWKHRIEDDELAFTVGVIYGRSGCGKSSLVKAGLLPRLSARIVAVYAEASLEETETGLVNRLRRSVPELPGDLDLTGTIAALRERPVLPPGRKVLIVLDQFEQWLHARRQEQDSELARALRQCDGEHVQCIVMVRDDFWVALSRFMGDLHIPILQGENAALVDLFDVRHARKVLATFGRAYEGCLPQWGEALTKDQESFLTRAAEDLAQDGRVISIRLALFADMVKGKPWVPATLNRVGGTEGVGEAFLEETFASAALRPYRQAGQAVLKALLPETGSEIKGHSRSRDELALAAGREGRPRELGQLLHVLDRDLRLITPTDRGVGGSVAGGEPIAPAQFYQLTHDYLVPSLRAWLTRKQKENRRGRAELRLADRSSLWNAKPENRHLPSLLEWLKIRTLTDTARWTEPQRKMMRQAARTHGWRSAVALAGLIAAAAVGLVLRNQVIEQREARSMRSWY